MTNIWEFLIQTLSVSVVIGIVLLVKFTFKDKLSPRWQYGVWGVLALRILLPVSVKRQLLLPISLWIEILKSIVEKRLGSVYSERYIPVNIKYSFPTLNEMPVSITDWLFVIYVAGIVVSLMWYFLSFVKLRLFLKKGTKVSVGLQRKIADVCEKYHVKACKAVCIPGLPSAFVCGGIRPVLALPMSDEIDEKIILHEILHLKYHDEIQSMLWCVLRCLHWCNPLVHYAINLVENDMESLCDQRVLERIEGEERRMYGKLLLEMANEEYARTPGTSSISNGGKNISKRIEAIVRFKKYPKGMALVSVCIVIVLLVPVIQGYAYNLTEGNYNIMQERELESAMAMTRIVRCGTVAGAIDTYAKGLMKENALYIATASSLSKHEIIREQMIKSGKDGWRISYYNSGKEFQYVFTDWNYRIYDLTKVSDECYQAYIAFQAKGFENDEGEFCHGENTSYSSGACLIVPIQINYEDAWVVKECGERIEALHSIEEFVYPENAIPYLWGYKAQGETGEVQIGMRTYHYVNNELENNNDFIGSIMHTNFAMMDKNIKPNAKFELAHYWDFAEYTYKEDDEGNLPEKSFAIQYVGVDSEKEKVEFSEIDANENGGGGTNHGEHWESRTVGTRRDRTLATGGSQTIPGEMEYVTFPNAYKVRIYWDGQVVEELTAFPTNDIRLGEEQGITADIAKNMMAAYMDAELKKTFKEEKDSIYQPTEEVSKEEVDTYIENYMFEDDFEEQNQLLESMNKIGVYRFEETYGSAYRNIYVGATNLMEPEIFYNANDGTWIVACAGYCHDESWRYQSASSIGEPDKWGIEYRNYEGTEYLIVKEVRGFLSNENGTDKVETTNQSDNLYMGFGFAIQDYSYKGEESTLPQPSEFMGYRWYGACTYGEGFENVSADILLHYEHTK